MPHRFRRIPFCFLFVLAATAVACAQSQPQASQPPASKPPIRALPLYEQCAALVENAGATAAIAVLKDKDSQKRIKAAETLAKSCDSRATKPLLAAVRDDDDVAVRVAAVEALGRLGDQEAIDPLIEAIEGADWHVRLAMTRTLASFQVYRANNATLNVLTNPGDKKITEEGDLRVRCQGILEVNQMRDVRFSRKAIGFLFLFLDHENPEFRRIARETAMALKDTRNGFHELAGILKQHNYPEFRLKAAQWLGKFNIEEARPALEEAAASDRDSNVKQAAQDALAAMKKP
ncbi:MAG: HEAT repeat domain-containing protein [Acidobacteriota bacterium]